MLSQAGIEAVWHVPCGGFPYGDESLLYVANDWHTALLPVYLRAFYQDHFKLGRARGPSSSCTTSRTRAEAHSDDAWRPGSAGLSHWGVFPGRPAWRARA